MVIIKTEKRAGRRYYVAKEGKQTLHRVSVKKSGMTLRQAQETYKRNHTFSTEYKEKRVNLGNIYEISRFYKKPISVKDKIEKPADALSMQYFIGSYEIGERNGIWARSDKISPSLEGKRQAYQKAEHRFYSLVDQYFNNTYDEDEGMRIVQNAKIRLQSGVVFYTSLKRRRQARKR